jgi:organic radical activating enzyme
MSEEEGLSQIDGIVIFGGEPFDQDIDEVLQDIGSFRERKPSLQVVIYTGYESLQDAASGWLESNPYKSALQHPFLKEADYIKIGSYRKDVPQNEGSSLASGNQKMFRVVRNGAFVPVGLEEVSF